MAKVLVIDECPDSLESASRQLRQSGFAVIESRDAIAGLQCAVEDTPDWILIEADLSILDGAEICRRLREDASTCDLPIAVCSSRPDAEQEARSLAAGADVFIDLSRPAFGQAPNLGDQGWALMGSCTPI